MKVGVKNGIPGLPDGKNSVLVLSLVLSQYRRVTDRRTDRQTEGHAAYN